MKPQVFRIRGFSPVRTHNGTRRCPPAAGGVAVVLPAPDSRPVEEWMDQAATTPTAASAISASFFDIRRMRVWRRLVPLGWPSVESERMACRLGQCSGMTPEASLSAGGDELRRL